MEEKQVTSIDEYISLFPDEIAEKLQSLRKTIREAAPEAAEKISYQMPAFALNGTLVYFAAHKNHIGFYPLPSGVDNFADELAEYKGTKGSLHFPYDRPLPLDLVRKIVRFRAEENKKLAQRKKK